MVTATPTLETEVPVQRPVQLPPPIYGEELVDQSLVLAIRDGSMALEDEDYLIGEIAKVYGAFLAFSEYVYWRPPAVEGPTTFGEEFQTGYEVKFVAETGRPIAFDVMASQDHGEPLFTKRIPRRTWPTIIAACPLYPSIKADEYHKMGFDPCEVGEFSNYAQWEAHVLRRHEPFLRSLEAVTEGDEKPVNALWQRCLSERTAVAALRRSSDPRIADAA